MKRGLFSDDVIRLVKSVEREFELFRLKMLSKSREEIFEECNNIHFYSCLHEYFLYKEDMDKEHIEACLKCENIIAALYRLYMKYEYLYCSRWEDIEEILNVLVYDQKEGKETEVMV